jgi:hypothetical protein
MLGAADRNIPFDIGANLVLNPGGGDLTTKKSIG